MYSFTNNILDTPTCKKLNKISRQIYLNFDQKIIEWSAKLFVVAK